MACAGFAAAKAGHVILSSSVARAGQCIQKYGLGQRYRPVWTTIRDNLLKIFESWR
jgi:uncharacterized protein YqgV (UPF0045/DUF77 family)